MGRKEHNPQQKQADRRRNELIIKCIIAVLGLIIIAMAAVLIIEVAIPGAQKMISSGNFLLGNSDKESGDGLIAEETQTDNSEEEERTENGDGTISGAQSLAVSAVLEEADLLAAMYDYDSAIECVRSSEYYDTDELLQEAKENYERAKENCVSWSPEEVTHIFFHTIIWDPSRAFDGDLDAEGYNQYMVTMNEFSAIMNSMYENGYVMVNLHDICEVNDDGTVSRKNVLLPEGKIPFVMSQDDVNYYHYMDGDGFAQKLIIDENGDVKTTYVEDDGTVSVGDFDLIPWIDTFVKEHPDFSYHGHKGEIALTGYEGILGYRTDEVYLTKDEERLTSWQREFLEANPDFDEEAWQNEVDTATMVADAIKENGWEFANHTWGHIDPLAKGYEGTVTDTERWLDNVGTIVGDTDIIVFAFGADLSDWQEYSEDNEYYVYLKSKGFNIYCCVDSTRYWVQFNGTSMRMGRRDIDGYRMYYNADYLADLFDVSLVWDSQRPSMVTELTDEAGTMSNQW